MRRTKATIGELEDEITALKRLNAELRARAGRTDALIGRLREVVEEADGKLVQLHLRLRHGGDQSRTPRPAGTKRISYGRRKFLQGDRL